MHQLFGSLCFLNRNVSRFFGFFYSKRSQIIFWLIVPILATIRRHWRVECFELHAKLCMCISITFTKIGSNAMWELHADRVHSANITCCMFESSSCFFFLFYIQFRIWILLFDFAEQAECKMETERRGKTKIFGTKKMWIEFHWWSATVFHWIHFTVMAKKMRFSIFKVLKIWHHICSIRKPSYCFH